MEHDAWLYGTPDDRARYFALMSMNLHGVKPPRPQLGPKQLAWMRDQGWMPDQRVAQREKEQE